MHISWLGQTCLKLQTKNLDKDVMVLLDPYRPKKGDFPRNFSPDIALFSQGQENSATISPGTFIIDSLGEMEIKGVMIYSLSGIEGSIIHKLNAENLNIVHLGRLQKRPTDAEIEKIMSPDILCIPVGGGESYLDAKTAAELANTLEPRIIIPMGYNCDTDADAAPLTSFIKELGLKPEVSEKKLIIKKKDLPQEETKLMVLEKE